VEAVLGQVVGNLMSAIAAQADQAVQAGPVEGLAGPRRKTDRWALGHGLASRLFPAGAGKGATRPRHPENTLGVERAGMVPDQAAKAFFDADHFDLKIAEAGFDDGANGGVESGAIATAGQDPHAPGRLG